MRWPCPALGFCARERERERERERIIEANMTQKKSTVKAMYIFNSAVVS
jgi:hypothetical protein